MSNNETFMYYLGLKYNNFFSSYVSYSAEMSQDASDDVQTDEDCEELVRYFLHFCCLYFWNIISKVFKNICNKKKTVFLTPT